MSQRVTYAVAKELVRGTLLYHNVIVFTGEDGEKIPATATVIGKVRLKDIEEFQLPIKLHYGTEAKTFVSKFSQDHWRTDEEKLEFTPTGRIKRTRAEEHKEMTEKALEQVQTISKHHVRRTKR